MCAPNFQKYHHQSVSENQPQARKSLLLDSGHSSSKSSSPGMETGRLPAPASLLILHLVSWTCQGLGHSANCIKTREKGKAQHGGSQEGTPQPPVLGMCPKLKGVVLDATIPTFVVTEVGSTDEWICEPLSWSVDAPWGMLEDGVGIHCLCQALKEISDPEK